MSAKLTDRKDEDEDKGRKGRKKEEREGRSKRGREGSRKEERRKKGRKEMTFRRGSKEIGRKRIEECSGGRKLGLGKTLKINSCGACVHRGDLL